MADSFVARGGWWVVGQSVLLIGVIFLGARYHGQWQSAWGLFAGGVLFLLGGAVGIAGVRALGRNRTAFPKPVEGSTLVQNGVYALVRHPLYCSVILVSFGWGLLRESGAALGTALVIAIFLDRKARREERWLHERFSEYAEYQKHVSRFIPWFW